MINSKYISASIFFVLLITSWQILPLFFYIPSYVLPTPIQIARETIHNFKLYQMHFKITAMESVIGLLIAFFMSAIISILFILWKPLRLGLFPFAIALQSIPVVAIAPIIIIWAKNIILSIIIISALVCFFPALVTLIKGLESIPTESFDVFYSFSASKADILFKLRIPYSIPYAFSALKVSCSLSVIGAIVGEFAGGEKGLGRFLLTSYYHVDTVRMFSAIIFSSFLAVLMFAIVSFMERIVLNKMNFRYQ